ncbi:hypothetical protein M876_17000 [Elizabethkingia anophelis FMS-007]|nr:hypothetical protein M876_17000 [Elizabethkingia anophelis FMS-007]
MLSHFLQELTTLKAVLPQDNTAFSHSSFSYDDINLFVKDYLYEINLSIIKGKYIECDIKSEGAQINLEIDQFEFDYPHLRQLKNYVDIIRRGLNMYTNFYIDVNNFYALGIIDFKPSLSIQPFAIFVKELKFLDLNIKINTVDNNFTSEESTLIKLFNLKNSLTRSSIAGNYSELHTALELKLNFLIYKWYLRAAQKENSTEYNSILTEQGRTLPSNVFEKWIKKTLNHYEIIGNDWISYFQSDYISSPYKFNDLNNFSFLKISNSIKYFKDIKFDDKSLKKIISDIELKQSQLSTISKLEKLSYNLLLGYAINNYYSCFCDKELKKFLVLKESNDRKIIEKCKELINSLVEEYDELLIKNQENINNFFLDYKITYTCLKLLNEAYEICNDKLLFIETFDDDVNSKITLILDNYKRKKKWSLNNNNYIFKLCHNESILPHGNINVYYASSFTLAKVNDDIESRFEEVYNLFKDLKLRFTLKYEIETIHDLNEEFKKDNKRIIEVVTIFTAIISFVVGSLGAFGSITNFKEAIILLLCFALAISIFVLLMYIANSKLNSSRKYNKINRITFIEKGNLWVGIKYPAFNLKLIRNILSIIIVYGLFIGLLYYLFQDKSLTEQKNTSSTSTKKDTIKSTPQQQGGKTNSKTNGT